MKTKALGVTQLKVSDVAAGRYIVALTVYTGESKDLSVEQLQRFINSVAAGQSWVNIDRTFHLGEIVEAHQYMESNQAKGKLVVLVNEP